jgi:hypothetical protein
MPLTVDEKEGKERVIEVLFFPFIKQLWLIKTKLEP